MTTNQIQFMEDGVFDKCAEAYKRFCKRHGFIHQQPSRTDTQEGDIVTLENSYRVLARYQVGPNRIRRIFPTLKEAAAGRRPKWYLADGGYRRSSLDKLAA